MIFDWVVSWMSVYYWYDMYVVLVEVCCVLKLGGCVLMIDIVGNDYLFFDMYL